MLYAAEPSPGRWSRSPKSRSDRAAFARDRTFHLALQALVIASHWPPMTRGARTRDRRDHVLQARQETVRAAQAARPAYTLSIARGSSRRPASGNGRRRSGTRRIRSPRCRASAGRRIVSDITSPAVSRLEARAAIVRIAAGARASCDLARELGIRHRRLRRCDPHYPDGEPVTVSSPSANWRLYSVSSTRADGRARRLQTPPSGYDYFGIPIALRLASIRIRRRSRPAHSSSSA